jgi:molecular chaperone GrpE
MKQKDNKPKKENTLHQEIEKLKEEKEEYLKGWQRERANFINYKKEEKTRFKEVMSFSNERLIKSLITILDGFNLAIQSFVQQGKSEEENENYLKGIYLIKNQLEDILKKEGVEAIEAKVGQPFDPTFHEAVTEVKDEKFDSHVIVEILEKGYILNGKIIRPCRVSVTK